ncbi:adrenodoxin-like protein 1, mitochondrial [Strongylocentrotus purpuratus]|uniref:2Fe-2S ferredoxin-type domain-containing protein n=1 Tax=Strongylocentrotus purpuratus TaxID=7668 RepID=A0A7M7T468_STRPU|nr:adrenodoxin-like protein 1, mitochondrial [Strongylocentrotus purpuratus]XP_030852617.1 adrenodoxin-like protein 1, mitochondrial [Strongylocentrotus purpuratus]
MALPMKQLVCRFRNILPTVVRSLSTKQLFTNHFHSISSNNHMKITHSTVVLRHIHAAIAGGLRHGDYEYEEPKSPEDVVTITYVTRDDERIEVKGKVGDNVMYLAHRHAIEVEGACEASLACCTCHVVLQDSYYDILPESTEEEEDMLDLAPFLTSTSRLSCQIILSKELDGMVVQLPKATRNFYVDGHVPQPH